MSNCQTTGVESKGVCRSATALAGLTGEVNSIDHLERIKSSAQDWPEIKHLSDVPEQVQSIEAPLWIGLGSDSLRHGHQPLEVSCAVWHQLVGGGSYDSYGLQGGTSMDFQWMFNGIGNRGICSPGRRLAVSL